VPRDRARLGSGSQLVGVGGAAGVLAAVDSLVQIGLFEADTVQSTSNSSARIIGSIV
jgi:hypothetical protein